jgi:hypothetical protein
MENKNDFWNRTAIRIALLAIALGSFSLSSSAQTAAAAVKNTVRATSTGAGIDTVRIGGVDCLVTPCGADIIDRAISQHPTVNTDGGQPKVTGSGKLKNPSGNPVPVAASARIGGVAAAKAIGKAAAKILPGTSTAIAIAELADELGFNWKKTPAGVEVTKDDPTACTVAPCYEYQGANTGSWYTSLQAAANNSVGSRDACAYTTYFPKSVIRVQLPTSYYFKYERCTDGYQPAGENVAAVQRRSALPVTDPEPVPSTEQELLDAIASKAGWPSGSKISPALTQSSEATGEPLEVTPSTQITSGPASTPGTTSTTNNTTNNTTTTATTTHHHSYAGDTVTTTNQTTTITINNTTGDTISNTTTTQTPVKPEEPKDACQDNPDRVACMDQDIPEGEIPRETKTITNAEENVFGAGSCPANLTASIGTLGATVTVWDWQKTCSAALPLRALVIALASFAALLIVMPGRVET